MERYLRALPKKVTAVIMSCAAVLITGCSITGGSQFYDSAFNDHNPAPATLGIPEAFGRTDEHSKVDSLHGQIEADFLFLRADLEGQAGRSGEAIEFLKSALVYDPQSATLMQKLSIEFYKKGQINDSLLWAERAKALEPQRRDLSMLVAGLYTTNKQYHKAEFEYVSLLKKDKDDTEALLYLGAVYSEMKLYRRAIEKFKALTQHPQYLTKHLAHYYLARVYLEQQNAAAEQSVQQQKVQQIVKENLNLALKGKPDFFDAISLLGQIIQREKGAQAAIQFFAAHQKKFGPMPKLAEILAQHYIEKNNFDLAYDQLEILDGYSDDQVQVKLKMALILIDKKKYELAVAKLKEILTLAPESDKVRFYLAAVYEERKLLKNAFDEYVKIEKSSSYFEESRLHAAYLAKAMGYADQALEILKESINHKVENAQTYFLMAQFFEEKKEYGKALETLALAEKKFPRNAQVVFYKGTIQDKMNLKEQMLISMKKVLEYDADHAQAMNYLAFSWAEMNTELDQAEKYARFALKKEKDDVYILDTLGWVLYKKGRYKEATELLEKAHALQPTIGIIAEHLGDIYAKIEKFDKAWTYFNLAVEHEADPGKKKEIQSKLSQVEANLKVRRPAAIVSGSEKTAQP